jgi:dihydropteroate synthase
MAVLNATPDSFSGDGILGGGRSDSLRDLVGALIRVGPDMIDVGAESTRPGHRPVPPSEQIDRLGPVLDVLAAMDCTIPVSIDTCSAEVAGYALDRGAVMINDVSGFRRDPAIVELAVERDTYLVATHSTQDSATPVIDPTLGGGYLSPNSAGADRDGGGRGSPGRSIVATVLHDLAELASQAIEAGARPDRVVLDPGIGFGKDTEENLTLVANLGELRSLGHPILLGPSRKRFLGDITGRPPAERVAATCAVAVLAAEQGIDLLRVHDAAAITDVLAVTRAVAAHRDRSTAGPARRH